MTMNRPESDPEKGKVLLAQIREGMDVIDRTGKKIGTVERVYLGEVNQDEVEEAIDHLDTTSSNRGGLKPGGKGLGQIMEDVFDPGDEIDELVEDRLLGHGFFRINGPGIEGSERYVTSDLIEAVSDHWVRMNVSLGSSTGS